MSLDLHPQKTFTVVRQIANHLDADTNYVRAVVRNALTDEIIDTLDLTDKGSQRFKRDWRVPADPSGEGFYISIVTSVYTDSGYTSKNANYGDEETTYFVVDRQTGRLGGAGGVDAFTVRKIFQEELVKVIKEPKEAEKIDLSGLATKSDIASVAADLKVALKPEAPEKPEKIDLEPVLSAIQEIKTAVEEKEVTPVTDLQPVIDKIETLEGERMVDAREMIDGSSDLAEKIEALPDKFIEIINKTEFQVAPTTATGKVLEPKETKPEAPKLDIRKLAI